MANLNIAIQIAAQDKASGPIGRIRGALGQLGNAGRSAASGLLRLGETAALGGLAAIGAGLAATATAGFSLNNSMEQATAKINAFTKDGAKTADILEMVQERAAKTPFAFNEMANAAAGLIPSANQAGVELESLIQDAEILAASNPAEGLEGAAFALREAVSGDFTSIIERFNLPRSYINQLKEEGVPALEIVRKAMQEMGYDTELVSNLANTAQGRWSTFADTLQNLASKITQPIFDRASTGLGALNDLLDQNAPKLEALATIMGGALADGLTRFEQFLIEVGPKIEEFGAGMGERLPAKIDQFITRLDEQTGRIETSLGRIGTALGFDEDINEVNVAMATLSAIMTVALFPVQQLADALLGIAYALEKVSEAWEISKGLFDQIQQINDLTGGSITEGMSTAAMVLTPGGLAQSQATQLTGVDFGSQLAPYFAELANAILAQPPIQVQATIDGAQVANVITPRVSQSVGQQIARQQRSGGVQR